MNAEEINILFENKRLIEEKNMKHCKHCNDTLFTEVYDTCMTCFEKQPTESTMIKTIEQYQQDCLWYQNEIKRLKSCCSNLQAVVKGDAYNIKRLSEENERLVKIYNDQKNILHEILHELPVGNVTSHSYENIPERVKYYVREHALLESNQDEANELIAQSMPDFFDHPSAGYILDNIALLIGIADKAKIEAWGDREDLETLEKAIKTHYDYYKGFAAKEHLSSVQMLDALLMLCVADISDHESLVDDNRKLHGELAKSIKDIISIENKRDHYKAALEEIIKRPRRSETCKLIAQKALGLLNDDDYQPELLIEENLKLKMKIEDLESTIVNNALNKIYPEKVNPLMCCEDCGEYWNYQHEQHCKANF